MSEPLVLGDSIRCGMVMAGQQRESVLDMARRIEATGFDSIWVGDHISFYIPILESLTLLSFVAAATERVRLCTGIYLAPLRHPTTSAKVTSTLDVLSGGRLTLGLGVGGEFPPEFEACGVPVKERGARTDESIEIMRRLWSEDGVEHQGRHFQFGPVTLAPKPIQPGGPPIIVGGRKGPSFRRAGQLGDGYISHMCSAEQYATNMEDIARHASAAGRKEVDFETVAFLFTVLDDDYDKALDRAASTLQMIYNRPFRDAAQKYCLLGRPADFLEQMQAFARSGARHFVFSMLSDPAQFIDAFEKEIRPGLSQIEL
ncbi:MAG: LLM class flavin-dependent oxidoreductase [Deltaproteobacteria bacterium]|nr:LLM class flavin-dependent oxidoreductase [Deltaproteobacteria bacterium]MBW2417070.1 LLM class flavin-dependent oxidoreductase [Deltaproteobacteria bacterium]